MYKTIIERITEILEGIPQVKKVYNYPVGFQNDVITKYPAVIFLPDSSDSSFSDSGANHRTLNFKVWVTVNGNAVDSQKLYTEILPTVVDAVMDGLDVGWDFGTVDGSRIWGRLSSGAWSLSVEAQSAVATAELNLIVRFDKQF